MSARRQLRAETVTASGKVPINTQGRLVSLMWKKHRTGASSGKSGSDRPSPWHAVSIVTTNASCHTARAMRSIRFLSHEAPRLPLPECGAGSSCPCGYKHHDDRRARPRRTEERSEEHTSELQARENI